MFRFILCKSQLPELSLLSPESLTHPVNSRWEVPIDGVILDGQQLPASQLAGSSSIVSALLDTVITVCVHLVTFWY